MSMLFENKKTNLKIVQEHDARYADLLLFLYNQYNPQQISMAKMRTDMKIMDLLEENREKDSFEMEDSMKASIKDIVANSSWAIRHKALIEFGDYIESL